MRAIDADKAIEVAQIKYNDWNLAMAAADGRREINLCFKKQELFKAVKAVLACVPTLTPPNEPLTLEQLREMDGEPVWVVVSENWRKTGIKDGWRLVCFHINDDRVRLYMFDTRAGARFFAEQDMGRSYWVYRRPPEGDV